MASNPYVNKVVYGNQTLLDLTDDTVTPEVLLQGYKAHDKSGIEIFGAYTPITPEIITPSNSSPVPLVADHVYKPSVGGYAIASYSNITPSANGTYFSSGFKKMSSSGYAYSAQFPVLGGTPDKTYAKNAAVTSGTTNITVTQKPRYIVIAIWGRNSNYRGFVGIVDVANSKAYRMGYVSSGAVNGDWTSGYSGYLPTISSTTVIYNEAGFGENHRVQIQIFY